jgi:hypothetical protein
LLAPRRPAAVSRRVLVAAIGATRSFLTGWQYA